MAKIAPIAAMIFSVAVFAFLGGTITAYYQIFPYPYIHDAGRTLWALIETVSPLRRTYIGERIETTAFPGSDAANRRWTVYDTSVPRLPVITFGGLNQYLELCPGDGCLAVTVDALGNVTETWPYRPAEIFAADITDGAFPHEVILFDPRISSRPFGIERYADGDILANFQATVSIFPFGLGVARIAQDGTPRWARFDYSHHWSTLRADGTAYVPSLKIGDGSINVILGTEPSIRRVTINCNRPYHDIIQLIDVSGGVVDEIELVPLLLKSNWAGIFPETTNFCDPLHLNYIDEISTDAGPGLSPGDLVVSLRNISAFFILDPEKRELKRMVSGTFLQQHSVHHLSGSKFLIFDNHGGDFQGPASRIVELDLATGMERRIFPNANTPEPFNHVFSGTAGYLDISPDRSRVLISVTHAGRVFEVDIASGRLLAVYDNIHDISSVPDAPEEKRALAARFTIYGMSYLSK